MPGVVGDPCARGPGGLAVIGSPCGRGTGGAAVVGDPCSPSRARSVPVPVEILSDAIIKPRLLYINGYDTGRQQSIDHRELKVGDWIYHVTGGRENGGWIESVKNTNPTGGQHSFVRTFTWQPNFGDSEALVLQAGKVIAFNLFGQVLAQSMKCLAFTANGTVPIDPQFIIEILPSRQLQAVLPNGTVIATSDPAVVVPADGWFALEPQIAISAIGNDTSGFVLLQLYTPDTSAEGLAAVRALGVKTRGGVGGDTIQGFAWGTEVLPARGPGLDGVGVDDVTLYGAYGTVKRLLRDTFVGPAFPMADGDVVQSTLSYDSRRVVSGENVGALSTWGVATRVNNLAGGPAIPNRDARIGEITQQRYVLGEISVFTGNWLDGPHPFPGDGVVRNRFNDLQKDLVRIAVERAGIASIEGVSPFVLSTVRYYDAQLTGGSDYEELGARLIADWLDANASFRVLLRLGAVEAIGRWDFAPFAVGIDNAVDSWRAMRFYTRNPWSVFERDPNGVAFTPTTLGALQVGVVGDFAIADALGYAHFLQYDIGQMGLEYAYHKQLVTETEHAPFPPVAKLLSVAGTDLAVGHLVVREASVGWDGAIVTRVVEWGDGSPTEAIAASPRFDEGGAAPIYPTLSHDYATYGNFTVTLTVTDANGVTDTDTVGAVVPNRAPAANWSAAMNLGDVTGKTADFSDLSTDVDGTIVSWDWDFGDGSPHSALQNPTHVYAAAGTYPVVLTVTDNGGLTSAAPADLVIPFPGGVSDCPLSADAIADAANVQGDDYAGGNPPLPAYANTAAFDAWYKGTGTFRDAYFNSYAAAATDHRIDTVRQFNGHPTLQMDFGAGHFGAGWDTQHSNDASPVEATTKPASLWFRRVFDADAGVMSDGAATTPLTGLTIVDINGSNIEYAVNIRQGRVKLDVNHRPTSDGHAFQTDTFDLMAETEFVGRGDGLFGELIGYYTKDLAARTSRLRLWWGTACSLAGASPSYDSGDIDSHIGTSGTGLTNELLLSGRQNNFAQNFNPAGAIKHLTVALWEQEPDSVNANPYGVSLV